MFQLIIFIGGLISVSLASPQWYNSKTQPSYGYFGGLSDKTAPLGPDGRVIDTPEVQHVKSAHLATLAEAIAHAPKGPSDYDVHENNYNNIFDNSEHASYGHSSSFGPRYHGPPAPLGPDGRVVDTPEVEAAKAHHFALYQEAAKKSAPPLHHSPSGYLNINSQYDTSGAYNPAWDSSTFNDARY